MRLLLLTVLLVLVLAGAPGASAAWTAPVAGPVVGGFRVGPDPYAAGQRRGVDFAARPGAGVVAPCSGLVSFVGRVPGFGVGVSLRCGALTATVLGLREGSVRAGSSVRRGKPIGAAGGRVRLGARVTGRRFGYRDPLSLLGADGSGPGPLIGPGRKSRRGVRPSPPPPTTPTPAAAPRAPDAPALAWIGVALIACALPGGAIVWRVRRQRVPLARMSARPR